MSTKKAIKIEVNMNIKTRTAVLYLANLSKNEYLKKVKNWFYNKLVKTYKSCNCCKISILNKCLRFHTLHLYFSKFSLLIKFLNQRV